ncbi:hypothetical protein ETAE_0846 [Edwardsiella piscicida]|uniref:Uncharacterized protein n=1 Tax=Edwardsiella piscicida TaxID=1263550 RepID=A0AAU8PBZ7_EDWPI|nr:hypothetical protein ETAE_0846 [Edwardsiella tarda EIB202]
MGVRGESVKKSAAYFIILMRISDLFSILGVLFDAGHAIASIFLM